MCKISIKTSAKPEYLLKELNKLDTLLADLPGEVYFKTWKRVPMYICITHWHDKETELVNQHMEKGPNLLRVMSHSSLTT